MYSPAHFQEDRAEVLLALIEQHPLAAIISSGASGLVADHIPLMFEAGQESHGTLIGHCAKSNPLWQAAPEQEHLLIFQGPSTYISPNWYASKAESGKVVPTWNYAVVHVYATLTTYQEPQALLALLNKLTKRHEETQSQPWQVADAPKGYTDALLGNIVGLELSIKRMQGKWKVSQNQPKANRQSVASGLQAVNNETASSMASLVEKFGGGSR